MNPSQIKHAITNALTNFSHGALKDNALTFFDTLGYHSDKRIDGELPD